MLETIPIKNIHPNPYQPKSRLAIPDDVRRRFGESILEYGLYQAPVVRKADGANRYECGDGWIRRAGFEWLVENGHPEYSDIQVDVREVSDQQMADMVMEANTVRKDLTPIDEAELYKKYIKDFGVTQEKLGEMHGHSQSEIANKLRLLALPKYIRTEISAGTLSGTHGRTLIPLMEFPNELQNMVKSLQKTPQSKAHLEESVRRSIYEQSESLTERSFGGPTFDIADCTVCEHQRLLPQPWDPNSKKEPRCFDRECYNKKQGKKGEADREKLKDAVIAKGVTKFSKGQPDHKTTREISGPSGAKVGSKKECNSCPKRTAWKQQYYDRFTVYCTDLKCLDEKVKAAEEVKAVREAEKVAAEAAERFAVFATVTIAKDDVAVVDHEALVLSFECIMRNDWGTVRALAEIFGLYDCSKLDKWEDLDADKVVPALREKPSAELLNMLPHFAYEALRDHLENTPDSHMMMIPKFKACPTYTAPAATEEKPKPRTRCKKTDAAEEVASDQDETAELYDERMAAEQEAVTADAE